MTLTPHDALLKRYKPQPSPSALLVDSEVGAQVGSAGASFAPKIYLYSTSIVPRMYLACTSLPHLEHTCEGVAEHSPGNRSALLQRVLKREKGPRKGKKCKKECYKS